MNTVLDKICADKRGHIERKKTQTPLTELKAQCEQQSTTRGFIRTLKSQEPALIAEVKKASPSKGIIRADFDPVQIAKTYASNGAACLSVLTDEPYFQGHDDYLAAIRAAVNIPILRKDFMLDTYQVYEARAIGADCILLIMAALEDTQAAQLYDLATSLELDTLFEVHDENELQRCLALAPKMVGVNNRNLKTLDVDLGPGMNLAATIPDTVVSVAESGINDYETLEAFQAVGYNAFLIGESLMRENDIGQATRKILGR